MEIKFILCVIKNLSSEWDPQSSLFVVFNIIVVIFLEEAYVTNKKICIERIVFTYA